MQTPEKAIETAPQIVDYLREQIAELERQIGDIQGKWQRLGRFGGQRADCAALLLTPVLQEVRSIANFCNDVASQVAALQADPFAD